MSSNTESRTRRLAGLILTGLVGVAMTLSAVGKLSGAKQLVDNFAKMHLGDYITEIAIIELVCALLFVVPRTQSLGTLLVTGYFGGAVVAHLAGASPAEIVPGLAIGAVAWVANYLRNPSMFASFQRS
ncbi:MAG: DoxX family protein [Kofleriaceae bacterium]|jgi:hypothetical protein|nr:DoxX family protein [Kofleriaceae bacterium]MBP6836433.1 DoxX family protein [Kofleriaceae bacterium]